MGYMDLTITGSDYASDAMGAMTKDMVKSLRNTLKEDGNGGGFNTGGVENVSMILCSVVCGNSDFDYCQTLIDFIAKTVLPKLRKLIVRSDKTMDWSDAGGDSNKKWHLEAYRGWQKKLEEWLDSQ